MELQLQTFCDLMSNDYTNGSNAGWTCACDFPASPESLFTETYNESWQF